MPICALVYLRLVSVKNKFYFLKVIQLTFLNLVMIVTLALTCTQMKG
jgi:hypothetical protein